MEGFGITHRGMVRKENQDSFLMETFDEGRGAALVLCDGMGGAQAGSVASSMASETFMSHVKACLADKNLKLGLDEIVREAAQYANIRVFDRSFTDFSCLGMGTTLVGALVRDDEGAVVNVGDSRAYLVSDGEIRRITKDHSFVAELLDRGALTPEQAKNHPQKNLITRALGVESKVNCDVFKRKFSTGDRLLLCSDGLSNMVSDNEILEQAVKAEEPQGICESLLNMALDRGAPDNVTVAVLIF